MRNSPVWLTTQVRCESTHRYKESSLSCFFASPTFRAAFVKSSWMMYSLETSPSAPPFSTYRAEPSDVPVVPNSEHPRLSDDIAQVGPVETVG